MARVAEDERFLKYPERLHHAVPGWVKSGAVFHIRLRVAPGNSIALTAPPVARALLSAAAHYHNVGRWHGTLFLLMPDHAHALLSFPPTAAMSRTIGDWKRYVSRETAVSWQPNYFDHRLRDDREAAEAFLYVMRNPAVKSLCREGETWPWMWKPE